MSRPNLLIITTDQHRGDCYGFEGRKVKTPHIDQLAAAGTRFQHCITPSATKPINHYVPDSRTDVKPYRASACLRLRALPTHPWCGR